MKRDFCINTEVADNLGVGIFRYTLAPKERFESVNPALFSMLGYTSLRDFSRLSFADLFVNPTDKDIFLTIIQKNKMIHSFEAALKAKNSKILWTTITARLFFPKRKDVGVLKGLVQNITSQKKIQNNLVRERDFFENLLDNIPDAVYFKDKKNRILKVNKFYTQGRSRKKEELIGKTDFNFFPYEQAAQMNKDDNQVLRTGKPIVGKIERTLLSDGTWNQVITTKIPMRDAKGEIIGTMGITRDMTAYANLEKQRLTMMIHALEVLGRALEMRDPYTFSHTRRVAGIAEEIAKALGWDENRLLAINLAGELHDLGKMSIPLDILNKPGKLNNLEYRLIQEHVQNCYNLIKGIEFPFPLAEIIYQHHERLDGSGYPRKLKGDDILLESRILAVSDVLEAMTHHRPYREALGISKACQELESGKGIKYDPEIVDITLDLVKKNGKKEFWLES